MDSGFGDEEGYNLYDKRLFESAGGRDSIYRPRNNAQVNPKPWTLNPKPQVHRPRNNAQVSPTS